MIRLGAWVVLVLAAVFFLTTGGTYPGIASVQAHVIGQVIAIAVLGGWLAIALVRPAWRPSTPLLLPIALASAAYLAAALVSQRPRLSFEPTIAGLGWALAFLFVSRLLAETWFRARVAVVMTAFVAVVAFGYLAQVAVEWINWWGLIGRLAVPPLRPSFVGLFLGSPNLVGTALVLLAPLVVTMTWSRYRRHGAAVALGVAAALAILVSGSRGAWLGFGIGALLAVGLAASRPGARSSLAGLVVRMRARPVLLLPVLLVGAAGLVLAPSLLARFAQGGGTLRVDLWRSALSIFADHPILGSGPGTWVQLKVAANPEGVPNLILPHAHDLYVQAAAELGIVGLAALAVLAFAVLRRLWAGWRSSLSLEAAAVIISLAAFAGQSIVDNLVNLPFVCLILVTLVAWIDGGLISAHALASSSGRPDPAPGLMARMAARLEGGPVVSIVGLVAFALLIPSLVRIDRAAALALDGNAAALQGYWQLALDNYDAARLMDPGFTLYELETAGALARVRRTGEARDMLATAVKSDPVAINVIGLAALEAELGNGDAALSHVRLAIELGVGEPVVALNAGLIAEELGDQDLALDAFADAIAWDPPLASSGIWASRTVPEAAIVEEARTRVEPHTGALIRAYAGEPDAARSELDRMPPFDRDEVYVAATEWLDRDTDAALSRLEDVLRIDPNDWFAAAWAARISAAAKDEAALDRYSRWSITVQGDSAPNVIRQLSVVPAAFDAPTASLPGNYPWAVYLRPVVPDLFVPQVLLIGAR